MDFSLGEAQGRGSSTPLANALSPGLPHPWSEAEGSILPHRDQKLPQVLLEPSFQKHRRVRARLSKGHHVCPSGGPAALRW